jgi:hypothetical protein
MKFLLTIFLLTSLNSFSQDSVKVKITRIETKDSVTYVTMKTKYAIYKTSCKCVVPYKEKQIIYIKKP